MKKAFDPLLFRADMELLAYRFLEWFDHYWVWVVIAVSALAMVAFSIASNVMRSLGIE